MVLLTFNVLRTYMKFHSCWDKMRALNITCKGGINSRVVLNYLKCVLHVQSALVTMVRSHNVSLFTIKQATSYKDGHTQYYYSTMSSESAVANVAPLEGNEDAVDAKKQQQR